MFIHLRNAPLLGFALIFTVAALAGLEAAWHLALSAAGGTHATGWEDAIRPGPIRDAVLWLGAGVLALRGLLKFARPPADGRSGDVALRDYSVRTLLAVLTLAVALPLLALIAYQVRVTATAEIAQANQFVKHLSDMNATDVEQTVGNLERALTVLAQRPLIRELASDRCDSRIGELQRTYPVLANVGTVDLQGQIVCTAVASADGRLPSLGRLPWLVDLERTNAFVVGTPQRGVFTGKPILVLAQPIRDAQGRPAGAAYVVLDLLKFLPLVVSTALPEGGVAGILNREGTVVARSFRPEEMVGKNVRGIGINNAILERKHGTEVSTGADGVERFYAFRPITHRGWFSVVGVPTERIYAQARKNAIDNSVMSAGVLLLALLLALFVHRRIVLPMLDLRTTAQRVGAGNTGLRAPLAGPREVVEVATGFNTMLDKLMATERQLETTEAQYHMLFQSSPDAMRVVCEERIVLMNPAGFRLLGLPDDALQSGKSVFDYVHPDYVDRARERLRSVIEERRALPVEERKSIRSDGSEIEVEVITLPVTYQGKPAALDIVHDLTERNTARQALQKANAELEQRVHERTVKLERANADLEAFSYTIAHDLRAPLRGINGFANLTLETQGDRIDAEGRQFLERVLHSADTMNNLLEGLLKLSHLSRAEAVFTNVDLSLCAREVIEELRAADPARRVDVTIQDGLTAWADSGLIRDVLENLIGNAWKYTGRVDAAKIEFGALHYAGNTTYFVRDNGAGFDPLHADKLFKTFQRLHAPQEFSGNGIGLASVKRVIEHHHGKVWAESAVGQGATFYFTLGAKPDIEQGPTPDIEPGHTIGFTFDGK